MSEPLLRDMLEFAVDAAWQAGRITLGYFHAESGSERKSDDSPVTDADRNSERMLRALISRYWPEHGILGEEFGHDPGVGGLTWVLDPLDGTRSFLHGVPLYAILVALMDEHGSPLLGVNHFPALNECIYAAQGEGCYWNGRRVHTSTVSDLKQSLVLASAIHTFPLYGKEAAWNRLVAETAMHRTWGDAYGYAMVATGRAEIMVDPIMEVWDCAPHKVILEEAGGTFTDWKGTPTIHARESVATNGVLFQRVMELLK